MLNQVCKVLIHCHREYVNIVKNDILNSENIWTDRTYQGIIEDNECISLNERGF